MAKIRVLLADDHQVMLARVRWQLGEEFDIVGTTNNGQDAVEAAMRLGPDVLVMDISMPVLDGFQAALRIRDSGCGTRVIFLTVHQDEDFVAAAFSAGVRGYVTKPRLSTDLARAICEALAGGSFVSPFNGLR